MPLLLHIDATPACLFTFTQHVDVLYEKLEDLSVDLHEISFLPSYEQIRPLRTLSSHLKKDGIALLKLQIKLNELSDTDLPLALLTKVDTLRYQFEDLQQVHTVLTQQVRYLQNALKSLDRHLGVPMFLNIDPI